MSDLNLSRRSFGKLAALAGTGIAASGPGAFVSQSAKEKSEILQKIKSFILENEKRFDVIVKSILSICNKPTPSLHGQ